MAVIDGGDGAALTPRIRILPQVGIVAAAVAAYFLVRGATNAECHSAVHNAHRVVALERWLGLYYEPRFQEAVVQSSVISRIFNTIYIFGHWPVIVATLLWLAYRHPAIYLRTRNAMLLSGAIGLVVFAAFPVAPPRLAGLGMTDTVSEASVAYRALQPTIFTNQYAAMPSLHVGWNLLIGLAIVLAARRLLARLAAVAMAIAMAVTVVLTANHYIMDAIIGASLTTICWIVVGWRQARRSSAVTPRFPARSQTRRVAIDAGFTAAKLASTPRTDYLGYSRHLRHSRRKDLPLVTPSGVRHDGAAGRLAGPGGAGAASSTRLPGGDPRTRIVG